MAIIPDLVVIKKVADIPVVPISTLEETGNFFAYDGTGTLKKTPVKQIIDRVTTDLKGVAKQDNTPTTYDALIYPNGLFEKWEVTTPLTLPNDWGFAVTQDQLDENKVYFNVTNGVVAVQLSAKISFANGSVTPEKTNFAKSGVFPIGKNILNPSLILANKGVHNASGGFYDTNDFDTFVGVGVKSETKYSFKDTYGINWFDKDGVFLLEEISTTNITSPVGARYVNIDYQKTSTPAKTPMVQEGYVDELIYEGFQGVDATKIEDLFFDLIIKNGSKIKIGDTTTDEITANDRRVFATNNAQNFFGGGAGGATLPSENGNNAWGFKALFKAVAGTFTGANVAFGHFALSELVNGWDNAAFGPGALEKLQEGTGLSAFGRLCLANILIGENQSAYGDTALEHLIEGLGAIGFGYGAGVRLKQAERTSLYGTYCGGFPGLTGWEDRIINDSDLSGNFAFQVLQEGYRSVGAGAIAGVALDKLYDSVVQGFYLFENATEIRRTVALGSKVGIGINVADRCVIIGHKATSTKNNLVGATIIGDEAVCTRDNEIVIGKNTDTHLTVAGIEFTKAQLIALKGLVS